MKLLLLVLYIAVNISKASSDEPPPELLCSLGLSHDSDCPVDGNWALWGTWHKCEGECGQQGHRSRRRLCTDPAPANGGAPCAGADRESELCKLPACTAEQYEKVVAGDPLRDGQFKVMQAVHERLPVLADRCLAADCQYETVKDVLHDGTMEYWNALHCVKHNVGCPVRGGWSQWDSWSPCSAICGGGSKFRRRTCTNPSPSLPELDCHGATFETSGCTGTACAPRQDGEWETWGSWSSCSNTCGIGIRKRTRTCKKRKQRDALEAEDLTNSDLTRETLSAEWHALTAERLVRALNVENRCSGAAEEVEQCEIKGCSVDGGWSAWEVWTMCSARCGLGSQSRSRACSSPTPRGSGNLCLGSVTEIQHCYQRPCQVRTHHVAIFSGEGALVYSASSRPCRLLHMYIRFLPLTTYGMLFHRYQERCLGSDCDFVRLKLEGGYLILGAHITGCTATVISRSKVEPGVWHEVLLTVRGTMASLRIDSSTDWSEVHFNCPPIQYNLDHAMRVGENFRGEIQQIIINYSPIRLKREGSAVYSTGAAPYTSSNVGYDTAERQEGFRHLASKELIHVPCPKNSHMWKIEMAVKPEKEGGLLLYMPGESSKDYILATIEESRVKLRVRQGELKTEAVSSTDMEVDKWLHLVVDRGGADEEGQTDIGMSVNGGQRITLSATAAEINPESPAPCKGEIMVGDIPQHLQKQIQDAEAQRSSSNILLTYLTGTLGYLAVDGVALDLEALPLEDENEHQMSSYSASIAERYEEVYILLGQQLNLTCLYDRSAATTRAKANARWLKLDVAIARREQHAADFEIKDYGRLSQLTAASYPSRDSIEGFYACWVQQSAGIGRIIIAFGVSLVDSTVEFNSIPADVMGALAATAVLLVVGFFVILGIHTFVNRHDRFGEYQNALRAIRGEHVSQDEELEHMISLLHTKQARIILGSDEAVMKSEEKLRSAMTRQRGGQDSYLPYTPSTSVFDYTPPATPNRHSQRANFVREATLKDKSYTIPLFNVDRSTGRNSQKKPRAKMGRKTGGKTKPVVNEKRNLRSKITPENSPLSSEDGNQSTIMENHQNNTSINHRTTHRNKNALNEIKKGLVPDEYRNINGNTCVKTVKDLRNRHKVASPHRNHERYNIDEYSNTDENFGDEHVTRKTQSDPTNYVVVSDDSLRCFADNVDPLEIVNSKRKADKKISVDAPFDDSYRRLHSDVRNSKEMVPLYVRLKDAIEERTREDTPTNSAQAQYPTVAKISEHIIDPNVTVKDLQELYSSEASMSFE